MKKLISYIIGAFLLIMSFSSFGENAYLNFALFFVAGLMCFPVVLDKINNNFISKYYIPIVVFLFILGTNLNKSDVKQEDVKKNEVVNKDKVDENVKKEQASNQLKKTDNKEADVVVSENELKPILNEFPDFKYEIIGDLKGFSSNGVVKSDVVFIKVNSCDEEKLKYLQKELQKNNLFPPIFKSGKFEIKVFYEFKIFMVENIEQNVDLKNVKSLYDSSSSMVELNDYLRKNTKGFCAMLYKMWDLKTYPTYEENFVMFMRP